MERIKFLNTEIDNLTMQEAIQRIDMLINTDKPSYVVTPNLDHIVMLEEDYEFAEVYKNADLIVADGKPLLWISKLFGKPIKEKISGSDLFPKLCGLAESKGYTVFIMGARKGVAEKAIQNIKCSFPKLEFVGAYSPTFGFEKKSDELDYMKKMVRKCRPDILAVSLGSPKGEKFIYKHLNDYDVPLSISIGATIDFEAKTVRRAPNWMSEIGLEWLFRIFQEPKRLGKRYLNDAIKIIPILRKYAGNWR